MAKKNAKKKSAKQPERTHKPAHRGGTITAHCLGQNPKHGDTAILAGGRVTVTYVAKSR